MSDNRLFQVLDALMPADRASARALLFRPTPDTDLEGIDPATATVVQGFFPYVAHFKARGFDVRQAPEGRFDVAIVFAERSKILTRAMIHQASQCADLVVVDGQKTDGIDSLSRDLRKRLGDGALGTILSKSHGKAFGFAASAVGDALNDWVLPAQSEVAEGFVTCAGIFSADGIDAASHLLAQALPAKLPGVIGDLGAGWGYLSRAILAREGVKALHLVEAEDAALACARRNITDARATFHWDDATRWKAPVKLDAVVMNPPFHTSRAADPTLGQAFLVAAAKLLKPNGHLWLVANRQLPYETTLAATFREFREVETAKGFKILHACKPLTRPV